MLNRNFWLLLGNRSFTRIAYHITTFASIIWVFQLTGVNISVSLWMIVFFAGSFFSSFVSGVASDNYDRKWIMVFSNFSWAAAVLLFLLVKESFLGILVVTFIVQALDEFFYPAQSAALPQVVTDKDLISANSILSITTYTGNFLGYFLAGIMLRFFGYPAPFIFAAVVVFLGALFSLGLPPLSPNGHNPTFGKFVREIKGQLVEQFHFLVDNLQVTSTILLVAVLGSGAAAAGSMAPGFAEQVLKIDAWDLSFIAVAPLAAGMLTGAYILSRRGKFLTVWGSITSFGMGLVILALSPTLHVFFSNHITKPQTFEAIPFFSLTIALIIFWLGLSASAISIPVVTSLQRITPKYNLGRTFAAGGTLAAIFTTVFSLVFGITADLFTPAIPVAVVGIFAIGVSFWVKHKVVIK